MSVTGLRKYVRHDMLFFSSARTDWNRVGLLDGETKIVWMNTNVDNSRSFEDNMQTGNQNEAVGAYRFWDCPE